MAEMINLGDEFYTKKCADYPDLCYVRVNALVPAFGEFRVFYSGHNIFGVELPGCGKWSRDVEDFKYQIGIGRYTKKDLPDPHQKHVKQRLKK